MIPILSKIIVSAMTSGVVSLGKKDNFLESIKVRIMKSNQSSPSEQSDQSDQSG